MTYCIGVMLDKGMIFASDSRTGTVTLVSVGALEGSVG